MEALLGRNRRTGAGVLALAAVLALVGVGATVSDPLAALVAGLAPVPEYRALVALTAVVVVLLALVVAAAHRGGGLAPNLALAAVPTAAWHWALLPGPSPARLTLRALVVGLVVGTVGYVLGRGLRIVRTGEPFPDDAVWRLLVGRDAAGARRWFLVVAGTGAVAAVASVLDVPDGSGVPTPAVAAWALLAVLSAVQAYSNGGLVPSWLLVFVPAFGFTYALGPPRPVGGAPVGFVVVSYLTTLLTLVVGTAGFAVGAVLWRLRGLVVGGTPEEV